MFIKEIVVNGVKKKAILFNVKHRGRFEAAYRYAIIKKGHRLAVVWFDDDCPQDLWVSDAAFEAGPATIRRIVQNALKTTSESYERFGVINRYYSADLRAEEWDGRVVLFTAPCGQNATVTKDELRRVLTALPELGVKVKS